MIDKYPPLAQELKDKYNDDFIYAKINCLVLKWKKQRIKDNMLDFAGIPTLKLGRAEEYAIDGIGPDSLWKSLGQFCCWHICNEDSVLEIIDFNPQNAALR